MKIQHQPLRVPKGWTDQAASLVMQIDSLFDDIYRQIALLKEKLKEIEEEE
jgi:ribosome-associated translation inhibitor RaiA